MSPHSSQLVLISGAGPTGITAALELRRFSIPVRIIDAQDGPSKTSRAIGIQARTLEELELRGLVNEFLRLGNPAKGGSIYGGGRRLLRMDFTQIESHYNFLLLLSEADTERILREALTKQGTKVEFGMKMIAFAQTADGVTATLEHKDGRLEEVSAAYLISAEGAHSTIRTRLHLEFKGKALDEKYALGDVHVDGDLPDSDLHLFSSERGFMGLFPLGGSHFRLIASSPAGNPSEESVPSLQELQTIYDERSHIPARLRLLGWSSWFHINSRMVDKLRVGRVFLGGDAAHIHSPAGAQGMNTGIQDMMNLAWKLALVVKGHASEKLLDTYEQDRLPVMRSILNETKGMTELLGAENPLVRSVFNHLAPWIGNLDFVEENAVARISQLALHYRDSTLSTNYSARGSLRAGDRVPELRVRAALHQGPGAQPEFEEGRLFSLLSPSRFTLLLVNVENAAALQTQIARTLEPWRQLVAVFQIEPPKGEARDKFQDYFGAVSSLVLVRPDAYAGFRGNERSVLKLAEYCRRWLSPGASQRAA